MTGYWQWTPGFSRLYLFGSRFLSHLVFWVAYYILFSLIWHKPEYGLFASFYLEFILMPVRIMAVYCMLYFLIPNYLEKRLYRAFVIGYVVLILGAGLLQMLFGAFFYEKLLVGSHESFQLSISGWVRNSILVNTTVLLLGCIKVFMLYVALKERTEHAIHSNEHDPHEVEQRQVHNNTETNDFIVVKSQRRNHRLNIKDILYVEGLGNYVTYHLSDGDKKVVYGSLKEAHQQLPDDFIRLHRSYLVNKNAIESFNNEEVFIANKTIPRSKDISDEQLVI